jgi:hypothetical protein
MATPKGRMTIRKGKSALQSSDMRLWDLGDAAPGTTLSKLENKYLSALDAVDKLEAHRAAAGVSGQLTSSLSFGLTISAPVSCCAAPANLERIKTPGSSGS